MIKPKLTIELVPSTSFYKNVRSILPTSEWDRLRKESYAKAKFKCQICGDVGTNQGYKHKLECHEIWVYQKDGVQLLKELVSLCPRCHQVKHIGRSIMVGLKKKVFAHIGKVNKWDKKLVEAYVGACFQAHKERSKIKWKINVGVLTEKFGVKKTLIDEGLRKKTLGQPTWKRKKKKKKKIVKKKSVAKKRPTKNK
jgi:hypothetical protein